MSCANLPGGDWGTFMPEAADLLDKDCDLNSELKELVLEELGDEIEPGATTVDAVVRGILSLLRSP
jgi:hypothetical protein